MSRLPWIRPSVSKHCGTCFFLVELSQLGLTSNYSGNYFLTELHHGLDVMNLETTATLKPDGSFDLHTPHKGAAKLVLRSHWTVWDISSFSKPGSCLLPFPVEHHQTPLSSPAWWSTGRIEE